MQSTEAHSLSRKQRERAQRHELFLSIGRNLLHENGFHQLSMDLVAEHAEYSKGTIYQHFRCKEELLIQLCLGCMHSLLVLGEKAASYPGSQREKLLAFLSAHELWLQIEPRDIYMLQNVHSDGVLNKISTDSLEGFRKMEASIIGLAAGFFQNAMDEGSLPVGELNAAELVYGTWSMCYGGQLLRTYETPLSEMGVRNPGRTITSLLQTTLNGLGWIPSMSQSETDQLLDKLENEFFSEIIERMRDDTAAHFSYRGIYYD